MINNRTLSNLAPTVTFTVIALGIWMWAIKPELLGLAIVGAGFLPAAWLLVITLKRTGIGTKTLAKGNRELRSAITVAGLLLALALGLSIAEIYQAIAPSMSERINSVVLGLVMILMGNYLPKTLQPQDKTTCIPKAEQRMKRFAGWTFVIAGFAYSIIWMFAPLEIAASLSMYAAGLGLAVIAIKFLWTRIERENDSDVM